MKNSLQLFIFIFFWPNYCCFNRLTLRDEWRLENRKAFANIWSDMVFGISLFILLYFNQSKVSCPLLFPSLAFIIEILQYGLPFIIITLFSNHHKKEWMRKHYLKVENELRKFRRKENAPVTILSSFFLETPLDSPIVMKEIWLPIEWTLQQIHTTETFLHTD